ncbi:M28 family peptidase [Aneurinibacillus tyrosinisolvens]|uniref:M28 family peptidase n=1 Tax=Aneurinibacillus tyrosinisolvens TaxID=1443435 RepID=UPI00063FC626|nr:M28 family peptidase [Aneurinibacillus tyrosinisolvens]
MTQKQLDAVQQLLVEEVSEKNLMEYTEEVSKEVRLSGTHEEYRAFQYVKDTLEGFGLSTQLLECDAYISLPGEASLRVDDKEFKCITHSMAQPTQEGGLQGELVYVGKGLPQDYQQADVQGKIVLIDGLAVPGAVKLAQQFGAIAALFINAAYTHEMIVSPVWGSPTPETQQLLPKIPVASVNHADGEGIKADVKGGAKLSVWMKTEVDTGWRKIPTLIAEIPGTVEPDKFVMFSGHIDSWHYGAMDNGSADATMMEVARILSENRDKLRRTLRLAFWSGHSHGRYAGSAWYCDTYWEELYENCVLHINVDSVGGKGATILSEANSMAETKDLAAGPVAAIADQEFIGSRFGRAGDQSFLGTGTPSLFMGLSEQQPSTDPAAQAFAMLFGGGRAGGFGWWWHTTEDTIDKLDPDNLVRDCKIYVGTVYEACSNPILPVNQLSAVQELKGHLIAYQEKAGERLDLAKSVDRITALENLVTEIYASIHNKILTEEQVSLVNQGLMDLSRILIPLNYIRGSIYEHDLALKQAPIPALAEIDQLAEVEVGSDAFYQYKTLLVRRVNRVNHALLQGSQVSTELLNKLAD